MALPLAYNWRNLLARKVSTTFTFAIVSVVVFVLSLLSSFAAGIRASLVASGSPRNLIVIKSGATAESTSLIPYEEAARLVQTPGLARAGRPGRSDAPRGTAAADTQETSAPADRLGDLSAGDPLLSVELCVQATLYRRADGSMANVAVRGVDEIAFAVHPEVRIVTGRALQQGAPEVIVGRAAHDRFAELDLGRTIQLGRRADRRYQVVGVFEAAGGALESEIWAPRTMVTDSYQRHLASSACLRLTDAAAAPDAIAYIKGPTVGLEAKRETEYYADLAAKTREIVLLTTILVGIMACGAVFAVANTMYAAVDGRRRELAMLRALGFGRRAIMLALLVEALLLCMAACACGLFASTLFSGVRQDYLSDTTFTVLAYELRVTPQTVGLALALAALMGVVGTWFPAMRAARINVLAALRKA